MAFHFFPHRPRPIFLPLTPAYTALRPTPFTLLLYPLTYLRTALLTLLPREFALPVTVHLVLALILVILRPYRTRTLNLSLVMIALTPAIQQAVHLMSRNDEAGALTLAAASTSWLLATCAYTCFTACKSLTLWYYWRKLGKMPFNETLLELNDNNAKSRHQEPTNEKP